MADSGGVSPGGPRISSVKRKRCVEIVKGRGCRVPDLHSSARPPFPASRPLRLAALEQQARSAAASTGVGQARAGSSNSVRQSRHLGGSEGTSGGSGRRRSSNGAGGGRFGSSDTQQQQQQREPPEPLYRRLDEAIAAGPAADALQLPRPEANTQVVGRLLPCCKMHAFPRLRLLAVQHPNSRQQHAPGALASPASTLHIEHQRCHGCMCVVPACEQPLPASRGSPAAAGGHRPAGDADGDQPPGL